MPVFTDADQFYDCTQTLFARIEEEDPHAADQIVTERLIIRIQCTEPDVEFTINGRKRPVETTFGPARMRPTLDITMGADTLHGIMLGELSLKTTLAKGKMKVHGPVWKATVLAELFHRTQALYPQVLHDCGANDGAGRNNHQ
jgi:hypothetical protein